MVLFALVLSLQAAVALIPPSDVVTTLPESFGQEEAAPAPYEDRHDPTDPLLAAKVEIDEFNASEPWIYSCDRRHQRVQRLNFERRFAMRRARIRSEFRRLYGSEVADHQGDSIRVMPCMGSPNSPLPRGSERYAAAIVRAERFLGLAADGRRTPRN